MQGRENKVSLTQQSVNSASKTYVTKLFSCHRLERLKAHIVIEEINVFSILDTRMLRGRNISLKPYLVVPKIHSNPCAVKNVG